MIENIMKRLLSLVLITSLLTSSVSPAFAQLRPVSKGVGKGVRALTNGGKTVQTTTRTANEAVEAVSQIGKSVSQIPAPNLNSSLYTTVSRSAAQRQLAFRGSIPQLQSLVRGGQFEGIAATIIDLPADNPQRAALLRNEFVSVALSGSAGKEQIAQAVEFYRADLMQRAALLADIPQQSAASFLEQTPPEILKVYQEIFSSAGALALFGNKREDAVILLDFWQHAKDGPLAEVATNITGRGLLRFEAYDEFSAWAQTAQPSGEVWLHLDAYIVKRDLPITLTLSNPDEFSLLPKEQLGAWLGEGCAVNAINAFLSPQATVWWVEDLGKDRDVLSYLLTHFPQAPAKPVQTPTPSTRSNPTAQIPPLTPIQPDLSSISFPTPADLTLSAPSLTEKTPASNPLQTVSPADPVKPVHFTSRAAVDNSGMLYSGIPFFHIGKTFSRWGQKIRSWKIFNRHTSSKVAFNEDPALHENTVQDVFGTQTDSAVSGPDDLVNLAAEEEPIFVGEHGFKLTIEGIDGEEQILHNVDVGIDSPIKTDGYNRLVLSNGHIFQLRNLTRTPYNLEHFYFELPHQTGGLWQLLSVQPKGLYLNRPLRIKLERAANARYRAVALRAFVEDNLHAVPVVAEVDASLLPAHPEGYLLIKRDGTVEFAAAHGGTPTLLQDFYVRLPKQESRYWAPLMQAQPHSNFALQIHPTAKKTNILTMGVPLFQVGLGKTVSPEFKARTTLGESSASAIMLGINNVLPVLMGFVHPLLRRYGEAAVMRWGMGFFVAGGAVALGSGLYGFLGDGLMSSWQVAGFLTSSVLIAMGTNITRFVQNLLITANRGKIVPKDSFSSPTEETSQGPAPVYNLQYLKNRAKQVVTQRPTSSARDVVLFQTGQMFKNIGTMAFLSAPWLVNAMAKGMFGVDLGLDFSASYVPYTAFGAWTLYKLRRTAFKDAVPSNVSAVQNNFQETLATVINDLKTQPRQLLQPGKEDILNAAKQLKGAIEILARVESRHQKISFEKLLVQHEAECVEELRAQLLAQGRSSTTANNAAQGLEEAFNSLGRRDVRLWQVLRSPKIFPAGLGMTLATMHELSVSNGFAFTMHNLLPDGAYANALTALVLYGSMSTGRLLGNWISRRISGGSMYALSSSLSLLGTATMVAANGNVPLLMTGAVIASFGVGNFFSQMYEYMTGLYPKFRREISLLINYTMPAAAMLAMPMRKLVGITGFAGMDLLVSGVGLVASMALTHGMFANSSIVLAGKYGLGQLKQYVKKVFSHKGKTPPADLNNSAAQ